MRMDANGTLGQGAAVDTVSFVLGEVVGSTRLWEQHPEQMPAVLARLATLVETELIRCGGHRPAEQGEGDNFVAAFPRPVDALEFAAALQAGFCAERWPGELAVTVRMAVHTGEARGREGGRYRRLRRAEREQRGTSALAPEPIEPDGTYLGETLNRCARLRALGHGGQVLVSGATAGLAGAGLDGELFLRDLGTQLLRDLSQPERVAQLCGPDLPFEFAPLRSLDRALTNLPVQLTSFVGRAAELAETMLLLAERRFVTLAGAGGCGKTRLAVQLAAEVLDEFPDGVWLTDLAPVTDPDLVARALARAAGVSELPGRLLLDALVDHFAGASALLVLDNCEHLLDGASVVAETLLRRCAGVRVLATSREPLGADGEATYRVPSLGLPHGAEDADCESVTLFTDRAALARPTMRFTGEELAAAAAICTRLDGIPLAIELAAARCRALTPSQISQRLAAHFDLLTGGSRRALPRHRALEASIEWSHQLLTSGERMLLHRLSVFAGGFTLEAAEAVGSDDPADAWAVVDLLAGLVDKSLVQQEDTGRYRLLETVRQFAESRLVAEGAAGAVRRRHAEHYLSFVETAEGDLYGPDGLACTCRLASELDNLRAADDWAAESGDVDLALRLMLPIDLFWQMHAVVEAVTRLARLLALPGGSPEVRRAALSMGTEFECLNGDIQNLTALAEDGLALVDEHTEPALHGYLRFYAGWGRMVAGDDTALDMVQEGVALLRTATKPRHRYALLDGLWGEAFIHLAHGATGEARRLTAEALAIARAGGSPISIGRSATFVGLFAAIAGDFPAARAPLEEAVELLTGVDPLFLFFPLGAIGLVECLSDRRPDGYSRLAARTDDARREHQYLALHLGSWAMAVLATHGYDESWREPVAEAEAMAVEMGLLWAAAWAQALRAENLLREGDLGAARAAAEAAAATVRASARAGLGRAPAELALARVQLAEGDWAGAEEAARRALAAAAGAELRLQQIEALELLARISRLSGSGLEAVRLLAAASRVRAEIEFPPPPAHEPVLAEDVTALRAELDEEAFEAAWAEGTRLGLADAVAYASRGHGPRRRPASGWPSLTPTELEVAQLVAEGLRNPQIADKLFVSPETVKTHVSNVLGKLGVANRTELAGLVGRRH